MLFIALNHDTLPFVELLIVALMFLIHSTAFKSTLSKYLDINDVFV